jgi:hypothetical protein
VNIERKEDDMIGGKRERGGVMRRKAGRNR